MGTTLLGVDLDESPLGGLVERLLTDEELEALTDGGRDEAGDGSNEPGPEPTAGDELTDTGTGRTTADQSRVEADGDTDGSGRAAGTETGESTVLGDSADRTTGTGGHSVVQETPSPDGEPGVSDDDEDEDDGGLVGRIRSLLPKIVAALVAVAVLAVVVWKFGGRAVSAVKGKLGRGDGDDDDDESADAAPAGGRVPPGEAAREHGAVSPTSKPEESPAPKSDDGGRDRSVERRPAGDVAAAATAGESTASEGTDAGALVGLAALALVAALVRKFGEDRPRDPLVDGPERDEDRRP